MSLVAVCLLAGVFGIYAQSLRPLAVETTALITALSSEIDLDTDAWDRHRLEAQGIQFAVPPGWRVSADDPDRVVAAESPRVIAAPGVAGRALLIERSEMGPRRQPENVAAEDFAGRRPALYDVGVDGHEALFVVSFRRGRVDRQAVYLEKDGRLLVFRGDGLDPAAFSSFVSTIRFFTPSNPQGPL
jgi:hypothetical protein